ncbi:synaptopodin-2 [Phyllostomus discolor]|uniref:Synaptopodin 2-like protein n=1 Tax=Phyllostomus discolor TaxID=89673 RepID=A0A6J2MBP7_9CHIR|nr:synaptopodin-2 [Phyllostomus discolor]
MGTGEFICVSMTGGAPWGFRLQGGAEQKQPLRVAKIRSQSKASGSGLREGDEVVSINGCPCAGLSHPQVVELMESVADSLHLLVKRASGGINETLAPETEPGTQQQPPQGGHVGSSTLQIQPALPSRDGDPCVVHVESGAPLEEDPGRGPALPGSSKEETGLSRPESPRTPTALRGLSTEGPARPGTVVELQLCLSRVVPSGAGPPVAALLGAETSPGPDPHPDSDCSGVALGNPAPSRQQAAPPLRSSKVVQLRGGRELRVARAGEAGGAGPPRVEVIFDCADRQRREGCGLPAAAGGVDSPGGGGRPEAPPPLAAFAASSEGTEPGDEPRSGRDHSRPHKHRARHARLRRSESLSEKQAKEAKSRCRSIALLLTAPPSPHARGVLMFKKLRQRARKFTLVSYGTGELQQRQAAAGDPEEDGHSDSPFEEALLGASESDGDEEEELPSDGDSSAHVLTFGWDPAPGGAEERPTREARMEMLPDTSGKGALMFAKRRERMDQIAAQREDAAGAAGAQADGPSAGTSYRRAEEAAVTRQSCVSRSYIEVSPGPGHAAPQHNGLGAAPYAEEALRTAPTNRTARPFPGPAAAFPPPRGWTSPTADFPAPPPYSAVTPPPGALAHPAGSPTAGPVQPPPWPQPAPWAPECIIASRDERIAVPAKRTGILQEAKRRGAAKPMFTFKEPKVSPNPELLSLLQNSEGRRGPGGAGGDSGPEEDYLSLGAEACNFMQGPSAKQKTPPPVAPKPAAKPSSPSSQPGTPATPVSPVWSPGLAPAHPPAFPAATQPQGAVASSVKIAPPSYPPARPASALSPAGPFRGPPAAVASVNYTASTAKPAAPEPAAAVGPPGELPGMQGRGAQLFAKRQSRMEKYVVDSDTVQAHAARAQSPTPSLPAGWKYSSNIRAPPPVGYNPIHSPSYPPAAAARSQPPAPQAPRPGRKKGKKPLNALDVMKHQPYQLSASLFTFQPPDAKAGLPQRSPAKVNSVPPARQAPPSPAASASSPAHRKAASVCSLPARGPQPAFFPEAASPVSASPVPGGAPSSPKQEPASTAAACLAPRPKFSAKKSGVAVQESGHSLSLPGRPAPPAVSAAPPWAHRPACSRPPQPGGGLAGASEGLLAPWEAAFQAPLGLTDDAFNPRTVRESIAENVVSAARRKGLPGPPEDWTDQLPCVPGAPRAGPGSLGRRGCDAAPPPGSHVPPGPQWSYGCSRQLSRTESETLSLETRSDYGLSVAGGDHNPRPRGWRRQT